MNETTVEDASDDQFPVYQLQCDALGVRVSNGSEHVIEVHGRVCERREWGVRGRVYLPDESGG